MARFRKYKRSVSVLLSGADQVVLMVRHWYRGWRGYFREFDPENRIHDDDYYRSWTSGGRRLQRLERRHGIVLCCNRSDNIYIRRGEGGQ